MQGKKKEPVKQDLGGLEEEEEVEMRTRMCGIDVCEVYLKE